MRATSTPAPQFDLRDLTLRLSGRTLLDGITLTANERRIGIIGRNGSGKTTLARVLAGLIPPTSGTATLNGADMMHDRKAALRNIGILFQNPDHQIIFPTVREELAFGLLQLGRSKSQVATQVTDILSKFNKSHWEDAATHTLSQGQKQLVCLMAVLAMAPKTVLLDEPYSGLDIATRLQLQRYVARIDTTVVLITHDPDALADFDRVIWVDGGKIRADGPPATVLPPFVAQMHDWGALDDLADLPD
ncbi:Biotin transport ATP-binding protein BioM [Aquimixticola soesokkakensis]|uniref:Biotin transport ATP-binding protein BioM n=1 Tax=Aquimixticola soesokkakensis TaxID=1519096 RepID=A0A1Y5TFX4_9RHOB|nr:ABC transporter ATP-binding protein [Aquimixticola soesokkakensis]SLN63087.1 Biotin transport ATP-binding protein BioM [Aquimixticola soesokkakensis]